MAALPPIPDDLQLYLSQIEPVITKTLTKENLPDTGFDAILSQSLTTCLHIRRVATKQRLKLAAFAARIAREQLQIWLAVHGTPNQQAKAMSQIMAENQDKVRRFLNAYTFRTNDIADEVLNESFRAFFAMIESGKPVLALISTVVNGIARNLALKQLRDTKKDSRQILEITYESNGDDEIGTFDYPNPPDEDLEPESVDVYLRVDPKESDSEESDSEESDSEKSDSKDQPEESNSEESDSEESDQKDQPKTVHKRVNFRELQRAIADCLERLREPRRSLMRLKYAFWRGYEGQLSEEQIDSSFDKLSMEQIAGLAGYKDAHNASVRLRETRGILQECLKSKLNLTTD
jgi:RNA polymerase sigma factor (sigma-70 family)